MGQVGSCCSGFKAENDNDGAVYQAHQSKHAETSDNARDHSPPTVVATDGAVSGQRDEGKNKERCRTQRKERTEINSCQYEIGDMLGEGGFGVVYEGTRLSDGLKVAVKFVTKTEDGDYFCIPGYPEPLTLELALHILISEGDKVPEIIQLLDWQDHPDYYVMVLECFSPCKDLCQLLKDKGGPFDEDLANIIMYQATTAAYKSCERGVFHRDIKLENLLINTDTLEVKLIDFGCGDLLKESTYDTFMGTEDYFCPEYFKTGEYHGKPATVYSLGVVLFIIVCGDFPDSEDYDSINKKIWCKDGMSKECCSLIQACLQENPENRIHLEQILKHKWFQDENLIVDLQNTVAQNSVNTQPDSDEDKLSFSLFSLTDKEKQSMGVEERYSFYSEVCGFMKHNVGSISETTKPADLCRQTASCRDTRVEKVINKDLLKFKLIDFGAEIF